MSISTLTIKELTDDGTVRSIAEVELDVMGNIVVTLDRKDDGSVYLKSAEVSRNEFWKEVESVLKLLKEFKILMTETSTTGQFLSSALYALKRYL